MRPLSGQTMACSLLTPNVQLGSLGTSVEKVLKIELEAGRLPKTKILKLRLQWTLKFVRTRKVKPCLLD